MNHEEAYQTALRGHRTTERTGKPHIARLSPTGDSERFLVSDPRHRNSRVVTISGDLILMHGTSALRLLKDRLK